MEDHEEKRPRIDRSSLKAIIRLLWSHRRSIALGLVALVFVDGLQLVIPKITQHVVDDLAQGSATQERLILAGIAIVVVSILMGGCRFIWRYFIIGSSQKIERDLRQDLYDHLQKLSPQFYDRTKVGDLMAHATNDLQAVRMACGMATLASFDSLILAIASLSVMMVMNVRLTLLTLLPLPILALVMFRFGSLVHRRFMSVQESFSALTERVQESLSGIRVVKAYGDEESEQRFFDTRAKDCADQNIRLGMIGGVFDPMIGALAMASMVILLSEGGSMVISGEVSLGEFVAFSSYLHTLIWPMMAVGWVVNLLQRGTASMDRLERIFTTPPDIVGGHREAPADTSIEVRGLSFAYPGTETQVLDDVSFSLPGGSTLGIVGRTGSGKTTLVELMMRLYDPPAGTILIGGTDIRDMSLEALRGFFGYVPQETFLFAMNVADNIAFGTGGLSRGQVEDLARKVQIQSEIESFPEGYDTLVGERGVTLSGGQKQRVAIARALATDPSILVLDDALSSVDTETEAAILSTLSESLGQRTGVVIAHRISTVKRADLIIVLDGGRLVESGTHDELLALGGIYADLHRMQQLEEEARRTPTAVGGD
ncbi:MAG: ABC transporter ATP-binding protein [Candidatus Fermentibacter sp.]|nr:ABC transporter ATP-binding protein [Candidatus Fermentibacter sp.]